MASQTKHGGKKAKHSGGASTGDQIQTEETGRTPGKAEGTVEAVEEALRRREGKRPLPAKSDQNQPEEPGRTPGKAEGDA
jgi:hypothetical protein